MSEEQTSTYKHSHDPMYLVSHLGDTDYPHYDSCHHCSYIRVPSLDQANARIKELEAKLDEFVKAIKFALYTDNDPNFYLAKEFLDKLENGKK